MTSPARAIPATISIDRLTSTNDLTEFAQFKHQLDGSQPYVRFFKLDTAASAPSDLLPESATIERCVTTDTSVNVLACLDGATIHIAVESRSTSIRVTAGSHTRAEELAEELRARACYQPTGAVSVRIWHQNHSNAMRTDHCIEAPHWRDILGNYPSPVRTSLDALGVAR